MRKKGVDPILKHIEDGEFPHLIKEQWDYHGRFRVYFRMSVAQFDALLAILEPHIKKKTTSFCELGVQGSLYSALCCEMKWMNLTIPFWILAFAYTVALNSQNTSQNAFYESEKWKESNPIRFFFYDGHKFQRQCVNVIDITWGRIYFSTCKNFGLCVQWL